MAAEGVERLLHLLAVVSALRGREVFDAGERRQSRLGPPWFFRRHCSLRLRSAVVPRVRHKYDLPHRLERARALVRLLTQLNSELTQLFLLDFRGRPAHRVDP